MSDTDKSKGWFGSTFNKLKSALSKTKPAIVGDNPDDDSMLEQRREQGEVDQGFELPQETDKGNGIIKDSSASIQSEIPGINPYSVQERDSAQELVNQKIEPALEAKPEPVVRDSAAEIAHPEAAVHQIEAETKPVVQEPRTEVTESEPVIQEVEPENVVHKPAPVVQKTESAAPEPEPAVYKPEPVVQKTEPAAPEPELVVHKPEPVGQKPEPAMDKPEPVVQMPSSAESTSVAKSENDTASRATKPETPAAFEPRSGRSFSQALKASSVESKKIEVDEDYLEGLEERLIKADIGLANAENLIENLRQSARGQNWTQEDVVAFLKREFLKILKSAPSSELSFRSDKLNIYFVVGVNGTGKTTSIGKLCWRLKQEGKKVLMAAGDTFRAAAESQLQIWSDRAQVDIVRLEDGADPGAVVYKALEKARDESYDCLVIDTAGRLHNKANLMAELKKVRNVLDKHGKGTNLESLLVVDASTGQNGLQQARVFTDMCSLTGVILTKLDGTAKGGIVFSIARDLGIPVKLIGLGEQIDDLKEFEPEMFVEALL